MLRRRSLERRLFSWMLVLALVPTLGLIAAGTWIWSDSLDRIGALGPWDRVGDSGRVLFDAAADAATADPVLAAALERHREELSGSLWLARRWTFLRSRVVALVPLAGLLFGLILGGAAWVAARRMARELARPIRELVGWIELIAREEALPPPGAGERREVSEVRALRGAFRAAASELGEARRRALEAERVRVWGEMARRVAHEMKNPLTPLRLALHRLARSQVGGPEQEEAITVIGEEVARLEELARQFSQLGRPPEGPRSPVDLGELLAGLLETDVPPPVETSLEAPSGLPLVEGHYEALVRVFRNLIRNAVEAMDGSDGVRRVDIRIQEVVPDRWVEVRIADRGPGLPEGAEEWIFEPDFTTKSRGTGLGLTLVRQVITAHGGVVELARPGPAGAEFVVRLPVQVGVEGTAKILRPEREADGYPSVQRTGQ